MNREIKFRGKLINSGKWSEGNLIIRKGNNAEILACTSPDATPIGTYGRIDIDTIGQYTGLKDKNGKEIYEGDIVKIRDINSKVVDIKPIKAVIDWSEEYLSYILLTTSIKDAFENLGDYLDFDIEVIGNIYDNPELLEV